MAGQASLGHERPQGGFIADQDHRVQVGQRLVRQFQGSDDFGWDSWPPHRVLADAILASDVDAAVAAINKILDAVEGEARAIIGVE